MQSMFGYLNLGNPTGIGDNESQECKNCRIDRGILEYQAWSVEDTLGRRAALPNGYTAILNTDWPNAGTIKWSETPDVAASLGIMGLDKPWKGPTGAAVAYGSQPYPAGTYNYALTLYNPDTGEESEPVLYEGVVIGVNEVFQLNNWPSYAADFPTKTSLEWRLYRMPIGGSEFLLTLSGISAVTTHASQQDTTADADLGAACDSEDNLVVPLRSSNVRCVILFNDHFFVGGITSEGGRAYFSKPGEWWAFPSDQFINFPKGVIGMALLNEVLLFMTLDGVFALYGDGKDTFSLRPIDNVEVACGRNAGRVLKSMLLFPSIEELGAGTIDPGENAVSAIMACDGSSIVNVSNKVRSLFPRFGYFDGASIDTNAKTKIFDNRFYVIELNNTDTSGSIADATTDTFLVVMDAYTMGFMTGDDSGLFAYKTKEFSLPRGWQFFKRLFVRGEGEFTVEFYCDGALVSSHSFNLSSVDTEYFNVPGKRFSTYSLRFTGASGAKIHDFGVDE